MGFSSSGSAKVGTIELWGGSTAPDGYLLCNGGTVSRTLYSVLFKVIGTTYGSGDGSTTFNLPNSSNLVTNVNTDVPVRGTGGTLGLMCRNNSGTIIPIGMTANANYYRTYPGSGNASLTNVIVPTDIASDNKVIGLTNDSTHSGVIGTVTRNILTCKHIIKY